MSLIDDKYTKLLAVTKHFIENDDMLIASMKANNDSAVAACLDIRRRILIQIKSLTDWTSPNWP